MGFRGLGFSLSITRALIGDTLCQPLCRAHVGVIRMIVPTKCSDRCVRVLFAEVQAVEII